ncbi:SDR family NAD(P)-dependent oxidoreductase [Acidiferrimicrobium sp. IK]|uniref:SDR family NAD(P)-dependent oxidoreductase n=1 Tax=Acidiferrimicrobium sp. IK TaxID=2871700 RepID=UPI0021CB57FE|nr:SDR family NAD(P)-dependent oxidoreductase [Acidiferrimicrobium sp. IK]MCU4183397.1 SDR family NAD(P)-dependent oxidoreductase [Acidiferrimicrobium sp. IK]
MASTLEGTVALVTGASSGIGEATAEALAAEGAAVAVVARRQDRLDDLVARITKDGGRAQAIAADVTDRAAAEAAVAGTVDAFGRLDIVINNAGVMLLGPAVGAPIEEWERMVSLNLTGLLYVAHAAAPHLLAAADDEPRRVADLVNISSVAGRVARAGSAVYNATKHGVGAFSEGLRQELTGRHVRVGLVEPGAVETELASHNRPEVLANIQKRFGGIERLQSEDIARAVLYMVTQPRHSAVNEILIRPTEQEG